MKPTELRPMLAKLTRELPRFGYLYEPKWDGFPYGQLDRDRALGPARFRHPARFRRWRPDREPHSCRFDQLA